jgi:hypothetical protein
MTIMNKMIDRLLFKQDIAILKINDLPEPDLVFFKGYFFIISINDILVDISIEAIRVIPPHIDPRSLEGIPKFIHFHNSCGQMGHFVLIIYHKMRGDPLTALYLERTVDLGGADIRQDNMRECILATFSKIHIQEKTGEIDQIFVVIVLLKFMKDMESDAFVEPQNRSIRFETLDVSILHQGDNLGEHVNISFFGVKHLVNCGYRTPSLVDQSSHSGTSFLEDPRNRIKIRDFGYFGTQLRWN